MTEAFETSGFCLSSLWEQKGYTAEQAEQKTGIAHLRELYIPFPKLLTLEQLEKLATLLELSPSALAGRIYGENNSETEVPEYEAGPVPETDKLDTLTNLWVGIQMRMYRMNHNISTFQMAQMIGIRNPNGISRLENDKYPEAYVRKVAVHEGISVEKLLGAKTVEQLRKKIERNYQGYLNKYQELRRIYMSHSSKTAEDFGL